MPDNPSPPSDPAISRVRLPLTVWPGITRPPGGDLAPGHLPGACCDPGALAALAALSVPGDLVITVPGPCAAFTAAARQAGRTACARPAPASAALVITTAVTAPDDAGPYARCQRALRPGGILAVLTAGPPGVQVPDLGLAVASARAAGLAYAQHIILVRAVIRDDHLDPGVRPAPAGPESGRRIHTDLLLFTKPGGTP